VYFADVYGAKVLAGASFPPITDKSGRKWLTRVVGRARQQDVRHRRPQALTGAQLAALFASVGGTEMTARPDDDATWIAAAVAHGLPERAAQNVASFGTAIREGALDQRTGDVEKLTGQLPRSVGEVLLGTVTPAGSAT